MRILSRKYGKWAALAAGALFVSAAAVLAWGIHGVYAPGGRAGKVVWVTIPPGAPSDQIGRLLQEKGVVSSPFWFRVYLLATRQAGVLQAGRYRFDTGLTIPQAVAELRRGAVSFNTVKVTIPEGFTVRQIAERLVQDHICTADAFWRQVRHGVFRYPFLSMIHPNKEVRDRLEGYLFPDTYDFLRGESAHSVIGTMLGEMNKVLNRTRLAEIRREGLTVAQAITLASMVEREAKLNRERPIIASVILNRLRHRPPMRLRIDSTIEYAVGFTPNITLADLKVNSPYNTYTHYGLPPGPISNPGLASIEAVLHPAHTDYYFYVAKNNGSGGHYFSTTFAQQLKNEALSQDNLARLEHSAKSKD